VTKKVLFPSKLVVLNIRSHWGIRWNEFSNDV